MSTGIISALSAETWVGEKETREATRRWPPFCCGKCGVVSNIPHKKTWWLRVYWLCSTGSYHCPVSRLPPCRNHHTWRNFKRCWQFQLMNATAWAVTCPMSESIWNRNLVVFIMVSKFGFVRGFPHVPDPSHHSLNHCYSSCKYELNNISPVIIWTLAFTPTPSSTAPEWLLPISGTKCGRYVAYPRTVNAMRSHRKAWW